MTAMTPASKFKGSGLISAQDLLGLMKSTSMSAFLRMKSYSSIVRTVKWKQRFLILANNEIYIYENEMSKRPESCLPLLGYNQIKRYTCEKYPWSFVILGAVSSIKPRVFACVTEVDRRMWMRKIKEHLYKANNIERPFVDALNSLASGTKEEYIDLEEPIFLPEDVEDKPDSELDDFDEAEITGDDKSSEEEELSKDALFAKNKARKFSTDSLGKNKDIPTIPVISPPPRYSAVVNDLGKRFQKFENDEEEGEEGEEEAKAADQALSKFERCLITDPSLERDQDSCKALLRGTNRLGVYLLRKSRRAESLVLAVLTENSEVREYRLEERNNLYRLQCRNIGTEYTSMDALLSCFSTETFLPGLKHFLTFGIFECPDEIYMDMQ